MKTAYIIILIFFIPLLSAEDLSLDLGSAVNMALEHNLDIAAQETGLAMKQKRKDASWNAFLPSVDAKSSLGYSADLANSSPGSPFDLSFGLQAGLTFSTGVSAMMRQAVLEYEQGLIDLETTKRKIGLNAKKAFFNILLGAENIKSFELSIATAQKRYDEAEKKFQAGRISELDTLRALANLENLKVQWDQAVITNAKIKMQFYLLLGLEPSAIVLFNGSLESEPVPLESEKIVAWYKANRPDLKSQQKSLDLLENQKDLAIGQELTPSLSLSYSFSPGINGPFSSDWGNSGNWDIRNSVGLSMTLPLDSWMPGSAGRLKIETAENSIALKEIEIKKTQNQGEADVRSLLLDIQKNRQAMDLLRKSVYFAQKVYELTEREYNAGAKDLLSVQEAYQELLKTKLDLSTAGYNYRASLLDLEYTLALPVTVLQGLLKE